VSVVDDPAVDEFPGLYQSQLPNECWLVSDDSREEFLVYSGSWRSREVSLLVIESDTIVAHSFRLS
jgi:hypothetical protein